MIEGAARVAAALLAAASAACAHAPPEPATARAEAAPAAAQAPAPAASPALLVNADFDAPALAGRSCPPSWGCSAHSEATSYAFELAPGPRGRYLKVTRVKPEPWGMAIQTMRKADWEGRRLRLTVAVNGESVEGGAGPMILLHGPGGRILGHRKALLARGPGWRRASVEIDVPAGTERIECALVIEGAGWAGFDDVEAVLLPRAGA